MKFVIKNVGAALLGLTMMASVASGAWIAQSGDNPIVFDQTATTDNLQVLMAAGAAQSGEMTLRSVDSYPKHFWLQDFNDTGDILEWSVNLATADYYHVDALISSNAGETFSLSVVETGSTLDFTKARRGWTKQDAGAIWLPSGTITLRLVRTSTEANAEIKSLELIRNSDRAGYLQRIADFRADSTWFSQAGYGLFFQYGNWGYPQTGDRKSLEDQTNDFDVSAFVSMVEGTGASYVIWSITWWDYLMNAPIASVDTYFGHGDRTSTRDLIGEIMNALDAKGIDFMLYYHRGEVWTAPWFLDTSYPKEEFSARGTGDRSGFFDSWETIISEIGNRYGDKLDGWFFDDGVVYYPAPFERLGAAARAGNPDRLISFNPWAATRVTDFQDVMFGEGHKGDLVTGSAGFAGDAILTDGPSAGLLQHGMFTLDNTWGVSQADQAITTQYTGSQLIGYWETASSLNVPISLAMMMWEDGSVSQDTLDALAELKAVSDLASDVMVSTWVSDTAQAVNNTDLAQSQYLSSSATGGNEVSTQHAELFNGLAGNADGDTADAGEVTMNNSNTVTVDFDTSVNTRGYDITVINSFFGWNTSGGGRSNQGYSIVVTHVDDSQTLLAKGANWLPNSPASYWTKVSFSHSTVSGLAIASGVKSITMDVTYNANAGGVVVAREIDVFGVPTQSSTVQIRKRNALDYCLNGGSGSFNEKNVTLWSYIAGHVNLTWEEIDRGDGYYSYQKIGTNYCLDGGHYGADNQNVYLWETDSTNYNQHWKKVDMGDGFYQLQKRNALDFSINGGSGGGDNKNVSLWSSSSSSYNLQWQIEYQ